MLKLFGGGGGNGDGKTRWQGKTFRIERYHVTVEDVLAEGGPLDADYVCLYSQRAQRERN